MHIHRKERKIDERKSINWMSLLTHQNIIDCLKYGTEHANYQNYKLLGH